MSQHISDVIQQISTGGVGKIFQSFKVLSILAIPFDNLQDFWESSYLHLKNFKYSTKEMFDCHFLEGYSKIEPEVQ